MTARSTPARLAASLALALALAGAAPDARAGGNAEKEAQALFLEGMRLMGKREYAEACAKLARSQELDPGMGTQYRLAECYEKLGRFASAYESFSAVADAAGAAGKQDRAAVARRRAAALEPRVARLTILLPPAVAAIPGLEVTRDGAPVEQRLWGTPVPVDAGDHLVRVTAPHKRPWEGKVWAERAAKVTVAVGALEDDAPPPPPPPPPRSMIPTIALGAGGGVGLVLGATFVGLRAGQVGDAHTLHDKILKAGGNCVAGGAKAFATDCRSLAKATSTGDTFGTASLVSFLVGGAALVGMTTYLLLPPPKAPRASAVQWAPVVGPDVAGVAAWGAF